MSFFSGAKRKKVDDDNEESKKQTCSGMRATCAFIAWYNCSSWCSPRGMRMVCMRLSTVGVFVLFFCFWSWSKREKVEADRIDATGQCALFFFSRKRFRFHPRPFPRPFVQSGFVALSREQQNYHRTYPLRRSGRGASRSGA